MTRGGGKEAGDHAQSLPRGSRLPRSARREQLLSAAQDIFVAHGYHGAAMDDIADRAGVSKPVLYQHFPGKLELYLALLDTQIDALIQRIRAALAVTTDNRLRVEGAVAAYFDFVDSKSEAFRLLFESDLRNDAEVRERVRVFFQSCVDAIAVTITEDTGVPPLRAQLLSSGLTGLAEMSARWWLDHRDNIDKAQAVELMSALAWRGMSGFPIQNTSSPVTSRTEGSPSA